MTMRLTFSLFAGASQPTRQQPSPVASANHGTSNLFAGKALTSDVASFSKVGSAQPRFGSWPSLHEAVYDSKNIISEGLRTQITQAMPDELNERDEDGCTPLHTAASLGYDKVVKLLLEQEATDPSIRESVDNCTARQLADGIDSRLAREKTIREFTNQGL